MKKIILILVLFISITDREYAQSTNDINSNFETPSNTFHRSFVFDLGKKNRMQLEIYSTKDLSYLQNADSIIAIFIHDLESMKDSFQRDVYSRTIEYNMDAPNLRRLSLNKHIGTTSNFVFTNGETSLLKVEQDTIIINGILPGVTSREFLKGSIQHYFRISFFLNDLNELSIYEGKLNDRMQLLMKSMDGKWYLDKDGGFHPLSYPEVRSRGKRGNMYKGNSLTLRPSIDIQNYKDCFVPSHTGGIAFVSNRNLVHREFCFGGTSYFIFKKDTDGKQKTYASYFAWISYGQSNINPYTKKWGGFYPYISLAYILRNKGDVFDKNSFKLTLGQFHLFGNYTRIEPGYYFNNFLHNISPTLRISQLF